MSIGFLAPGSAQDLSVRARRIAMVAFDVDGTLTDGAIIMAQTGELAKRFDVRDGFGIRLLREAGIKLAIITGRSSEIVALRAQDLQFDQVMQGVKDKAAAFNELAQRSGLATSDIAMLGDDWPDAPAMRIAGLAAAPADAQPEIRELAHWVSKSRAGAGAVREFCEWLLVSQGKWEAARARYGFEPESR
jgi:3-deoxy-D-manno-octulosonate 8-phosphate phosphatase (KDO 8-P phosphatase)